MKRARGKCPTCGRIIAIMRGSGPYATGRGEVIPYKGVGLPWPERICLGGRPLQEPA